MSGSITYMASHSTVSVYAVAQDEAARHKWIESEKAGYDRGHEAVKEWEQLHWSPWCRARWMEHLRGERFWSEFNFSAFALLTHYNPPNARLLIHILRQLHYGAENLSILIWVIEEEENLSDALNILRVLDINAARLPVEA